MASPKLKLRHELKVGLELNLMLEFKKGFSLRKA